MIEIVVFAVFFGSIVIGSEIADKLGKLPSAEAMQQEDQVRYAKIEHST